jgi:GDP-D-mannose dehydratase
MKLNIYLEIQLKLKKNLKWQPEYSFDDLVEAMVQNDLTEAAKDSTLYKEGLIKPTWEYPI